MWELVNSDYGQEGPTQTHRMKVDGGWLYRVIARVGVSITFVKELN